MSFASIFRIAVPQESTYFGGVMITANRQQGSVTFEYSDTGENRSTSDKPSKSSIVSTGFVVSSQYCHFLSVPWSDLLLDTKAVDLYYRGAFAEVYGDVVTKAQFAAADEPQGQARVVCALDSSVIDSLLAWSDRNGRQVSFVRPVVQVAFEFFRAGMTGASGLFALREPSVLSLLTWENGRVAEIDTFSVSDQDWKTRLDDEVARIRLQSGNAGKLYLADPWSDGVSVEGEDACVLQWPAFSMASPDPMCRLATCGL